MVFIMLKLKQGITKHEVDRWGTERWFLDDERHRLDGPAVERVDGYQEWYKNGLLHRDDGPAIDCQNGTTMWYQHNKKHRADGPAVEWADGGEEWWINGNELSVDEFVLYRFTKGI